MVNNKQKIARESIEDAIYGSKARTIASLQSAISQECYSIVSAICPVNQNFQ